MGVETYLLSASLIGVLSQRLLRKLCTHCRQPYQPKEATLARFGLGQPKQRHQLLSATGQQHLQPLPWPWLQGPHRRLRGDARQ